MNAPMNRHSGWSPGPGERGAALITALLFLVLLTALALASVMTGSTESKIASNERANKLAVDHAVAGVHLAVAALEANDLYTVLRATAVPTAPLPDPYTITQTGYTDKDGNDVTVALSDNITFTTVVGYKTEDSIHWVDKVPGPGDPSDHQVLGYCKNNGYGRAPITAYDKSFPVYRIESTGRVMSGPDTVGTATVVMEVTKNTINIDVPAGLYSTAPINCNGGVDISGASNCPGSADLPAYISPVAPIDTGTGVIDPAGETDPAEARDLNDTEAVLGMSKEELIVMAKSTGHYYEQGTATWANLPDASTKSFNEADYVTETNPIVIYVKPLPGSTFTLQSNSNNYGILFVDGDMETAGNANWKGLIYITGRLDAATGTVNVYGAVMSGAGVETTLGGNVNIQYDCQRLQNIAEGAFNTKIINWQRVYAF